LVPASGAWLFPCGVTVLRAALVDTTLIFHDDIHELKKIHSRSMMRANYKQGLENFFLRN